MNRFCQLLLAANLASFVAACGSSAPGGNAATDAPQGTSGDDGGGGWDGASFEVAAGPDFDGGGGAGGSTTKCVPTSCAKLGASCGDYDDGCRGTLHCGICGQG